jgi:hypothetical protein
LAACPEAKAAEDDHPDVNFGYGYATVSLRTKKIKGLQENDFITAAKIDQLAQPPNGRRFKARLPPFSSRLSRYRNADRDATETPLRGRTGNFYRLRRGLR